MRRSVIVLDGAGRDWRAPRVAVSAVLLSRQRFGRWSWQLFWVREVPTRDGVRIVLDRHIHSGSAPLHCQAVLAARQLSVRMTPRSVS